VLGLGHLRVLGRTGCKRCMISGRLLGWPNQAQSSVGTRSNEMAAANVVESGVYLNCLLGGQWSAGEGHSLKFVGEIDSTDHPRLLPDEYAARLLRSERRLDER
jgi:hypothetical protein